MEEQTKGYVHSIETLGSVDGPGVRFVVFIHGVACVMNFAATRHTRNIGERKRIYCRCNFRPSRTLPRSYWETRRITISGGEPLLQIDFLIELFKGEERGIHQSATCGNHLAMMSLSFFSRLKS